MIFLRHDDQHEPDETPNFLPSPGASAQFLFDTHECFRKSFIGVTGSNRTAGQLSIRYESKLHRTPPPCKKIAN